MTPGREQPRRDVSAVPHQGSDVANRCPLRVQYDLLPPPGTDPIDPSPAKRARLDDGIAFRAEIVTELQRLHPHAVTIDERVRGDERRDATTAAMAAGVPIIVGGELPADDGGRRIGDPDVLLRAEQLGAGRWAYHPVEVKHHKTLRPAEEPERPALVSRLASPHLDDAEPDSAWEPSRRVDDLLQLAHDHRMLQAAGHASPRAFGGIIGKERHVTWHDLDAAQLEHRWWGKQRPRESALQRADAEFAFRLDVLAAALAGEPIVGPVRIQECDECPWRGLCLPQMVAEDSLSLLPRHGYREWYIHRAHGRHTRRDVARLDHRSALIRDDLDDVGDLLALVERAAQTSPSTPIADLATQPTEVEVLERHGIRVAADLLALDAAVVATARRPLRALAEAIDQARVASFGGSTPHRRRDVDAVNVPAADVEVDIDMENALNSSVYLWGTLLDGEYRPFVSWEPADSLVEAQVFAEFWDWLGQVRADAVQTGRTLAVYCWHQWAEIGALRRGARHAAARLGRTDDPTQVEDFVASGQLVDLLQVFNAQVVTGEASGLKKVAPLAGFHWRADDAGGDASMLWHRDATTHPDADVRADRRARLLAYNEDDVRATATVRTWLRTTALPSVAAIEITS